LKLLAVFLLEADGGFDTFLPAVEEKQAFLRSKGKVAFFPLPVFQDAKIFEEFANILSLRAGNGDVVGGPRVASDFVFAPTGVASRLGVHFQKDKIVEAAFAKAPGGAEAGDASTDNDDGTFFDALRWGKAGAVAQEMAYLEGIVDERAFDFLFTFDGKADERRAAKTEKVAAAKLQ